MEESLEWGTAVTTLIRIALGWDSSSSVANAVEGGDFAVMTFRMEGNRRRRCRRRRSRRISFKWVGRENETWQLFESGCQICNFTCHWSCPALLLRLLLLSNPILTCRHPMPLTLHLPEAQKNRTTYKTHKCSEFLLYCRISSGTSTTATD